MIHFGRLSFLSAALWGVFLFVPSAQAVNCGGPQVCGAFFGQCVTTPASSCSCPLGQTGAQCQNRDAIVCGGGNWECSGGQECDLSACAVEQPPTNPGEPGEPGGSCRELGATCSEPGQTCCEGASCNGGRCVQNCAQINQPASSYEFGCCLGARANEAGICEKYCSQVGEPVNEEMGYGCCSGAKDVGGLCVKSCSLPGEAETSSSPCCSGGTANESGVCQLACSSVGQAADSSPGKCCLSGSTPDADGICRLGCASIGSQPTSTKPCCSGSTENSMGVCAAVCAEQGQYASSQPGGCCSGLAEMDDGRCGVVCASEGELASLKPAGCCAGLNLGSNGRCVSPVNVSISILPAAAKHFVGQTITARATGASNPVGTIVSISGPGSCSGSCENAFGLATMEFKPSAAGTYSFTARATFNGLTDEAVGSIEVLDVARIELTPSSVVLGMGQKTTFVATAYDSADKVLSDAVFEWSATGGSIDDKGAYTAGTAAGTFNVTATIGIIQAQASVRVVDPLIEIEPAEAKLQINRSLTFTAVVKESGGALISPQPTVVWTQVSGCGTLSGNKFIAPVDLKPSNQPCTATVRASALGKEKTTTVTVEDIQGLRLEMTSPLNSVLMASANSGFAWTALVATAELPEGWKVLNVNFTGPNNESLGSGDRNADSNSYYKYVNLPLDGALSGGARWKSSIPVLRAQMKVVDTLANSLTEKTVDSSNAGSATVALQPTAQLSLSKTVIRSTETVTFTVGSNVPWMMASVRGGDSNDIFTSVNPGADGVGKTPMMLPPGIHTFRAIVTGQPPVNLGEGSQSGFDSLPSAPVTITVIDAGARPTVALTNPVFGAVVEEGTSLTLRGEVMAYSGTQIKKVWFAEGNNVLGTVGNTPPYTMPLTNLRPGVYNYTIAATDSQNMTSTATYVLLTVSTRPTVSFLEPVNNFVATVGTPVDFLLKAKAPGSAVSKVELLNAANVLIDEAVVLDSSYTVRWMPSAAGLFTFKARVTNAYGIVAWSTPITVDSRDAGGNRPPLIEKQPVNRSAAVGQKALFSVTASGVPAPSYQWQVMRRNTSVFVPLTGETRSTLNYGPVLSSENMQAVRVVVSNTLGSVTSTDVLLTVLPAPDLEATISGNQDVLIGSASRPFTVTVTGGVAPFRYQWQWATASGPWANLAGETSDRFSMTPTSLSQSGTRYRCVILDSNPESAKTIESPEAVLTVLPLPPLAVTHSGDQFVLANQMAIFVATARNGTSPYSYQWQMRHRTTGNVFVDVAGATSPAYQVIPVDRSLDKAEYRCQVTDAVGEVAVSVAAILNIGELTPGNHAVFEEMSPVPAELMINQTAIVFVTLRNMGTTVWTSTGSYSLISQQPERNSTWTIFQAYLDPAERIAPNMTKTFALTIKAPAKGGTYPFQWRMAGSSGSFGQMTPLKTITVNAPFVPVPVPPSPSNFSAMPPKDQTVVADTASEPFETQAFGGIAPYSYQWQFSTNGGLLWVDLDGQTERTLVVTPMLSQNGTLYRCAVRDSVTAHVQTLPAMLTVISAVPSINPAGLPSTVPADAGLSVNVAPGVERVQWSIAPVEMNLRGAAASPSQTSTMVGRPGLISRTLNAGQVFDLSGLRLAPGVYDLEMIAINGFGHYSAPVVTRITIMAAASFADIRVYPNPWRQDQHSDIGVTFDNLPGGSTVKIFTLSGHAVQTLHAVSTGVVEWNLQNDSGERVASGIYLYLIKDPAGNKTRGKFAVIR